MLGVPHLIAQDGTTPLYFAALNGHLDIVRLLLDRSANVDAAWKVSEVWLRARGRQGVWWGVRGATRSQVPHTGHTHRLPSAIPPGRLHHPSASSTGSLSSAHAHGLTSGQVRMPRPQALLPTHDHMPGIPH